MIDLCIIKIQLLVFSVYHKDRSNLYKRRINPLDESEYDAHLFRQQTEWGEFTPPRGLMAFDLPSREDYQRHVTQETIDSGFVSMGVQSAQPRLKVADMA